MMRRALIGEELWDELAQLVPVVPRSVKGGRPRLDDRAVFNGILFVLYTGIAWEDLPQELGFAVAWDFEGDLEGTEVIENF